MKLKYQNKQGEVAENFFLGFVNIQPLMLLSGPYDPLMGHGSQGSHMASKEQMWHNFQIEAAQFLLVGIFAFLHFCIFAGRHFSLPGNPGMPGMLAAAPHSMKGLTFKQKRKLKQKNK